MKKVFGSHSEVAHIWAQQNQAEGKASRVFFEGPTIYSYGHHFPMARFVDKNTVFLTTKGYSVSTSKHMGYVRHSLSGENVFLVRDVMATDQRENVSAMMKDLEALRAQAIRARTHKEFLQGNVISGITHLREFIKRFPVKMTGSEKERLEMFLTIDPFSPEMVEKIKAAEREKARLNALEIKRLEKENAEKIREWQTGQRLDVPSYGLSRVYLRVQGDDVQTSKGARIPLPIAHRLWDRIKSGENVGGMDLGHYSVDMFDGKELKAGCHTIELTEMQRLAGVLGW